MRLRLPWRFIWRHQWRWRADERQNVQARVRRRACPPGTSPLRFLIDFSMFSAARQTWRRSIPPTPRPSHGPRTGTSTMVWELAFVPERQRYGEQNSAEAENGRSVSRLTSPWMDWVVDSMNLNDYVVIIIIIIFV